MEERWSVELLECLAQKAGCGYLSDLRYLSPWEQFHLSRELLHVPSEAFSLKTWNDALAYLTGLSQQADASAAKERLYILLRSLSVHVMLLLLIEFPVNSRKLCIRFIQETSLEEIDPARR